jgi:hypothetical protein
VKAGHIKLVINETKRKTTETVKITIRAMKSYQATNMHFIGAPERAKKVEGTEAYLKK